MVAVIRKHVAATYFLTARVTARESVWLRTNLEGGWKNGPKWATG